MRTGFAAAAFALLASSSPAQASPGRSLFANVPLRDGGGRQVGNLHATLHFGPLQASTDGRSEERTFMVRIHAYHDSAGLFADARAAGIRELTLELTPDTAAGSHPSASAKATIMHLSLPPPPEVRRINDRALELLAFGNDGAPAQPRQVGEGIYVHHGGVPVTKVIRWEKPEAGAAPMRIVLDARASAIGRGGQEIASTARSPAGTFEIGAGGVMRIGPDGLKVQDRE